MGGGYGLLCVIFQRIHSFSWHNLQREVYPIYICIRGGEQCHPHVWSFRVSQIIWRSNLRPGMVSLPARRRHQDRCPQLLYSDRNILHVFRYNLSFPSGTSGKESACQCRRVRRQGLSPWVGRIPWRGNEGHLLTLNCILSPYPGICFPSLLKKFLVCGFNTWFY